MMMIRFALVAALVASDPAPLSAPPAALGLAPFYKKYLDCDGLPIVASEKTPDAALREARRLVLKMVEKRPEALESIVRAKIRVAILAKSELTTDIPEYATLSPKEYWDARARGLGATAARPVVSGAEENLLAHADDRYRGESIFIHEFAHTLHRFGAAASDPTFDARLRAAYDDAIAKGLWKGTYAAENPEEYWAEGVQTWFDANMKGDVDTREKLKLHDPALSALIAEWLPGDEWRFTPPLAPAGRKADR